VPRRLLALVVTALVGLAGGGCADDVSPALRIGDTKIGNEAFLDEVAEWARNTPLQERFQLPSPTGAGVGTFSSSFAGAVMSNRIFFELHNQQFKELGLKLDEDERTEFRESSELLLREFSDAYAAMLIDDVVRQFNVQEEMGADYDAWVSETLAEADIEVSPRYGTWDGESGQVLPPPGPIGSATPQPAFGQ
jgi:hypothetical protein